MAATRKDYHVYRLIEEEMQKNGFGGKDAGQIYHKWKNLKRAFYQSKKLNKGRAICEFAEELADILEKPCAMKRREPGKHSTVARARANRTMLMLFVTYSCRSTS